MKTEKSNTIRIELTYQELEYIYNALNRLAIHYGDKSDSLRKIKSDDPTTAREAILHPDFYMRKWEEVGDIKQRIYKAQEKITNRK